MTQDTRPAVAPTDDVALVEAVARAICLALYQAADRLVLDGVPLWKGYEHVARAAIAAMQAYQPPRPVDLPAEAD